MAEINLLPNDFRDKEERELKTAHKRPKRESIELTNPQKSQAGSTLKTPRPSLLSRLFAKRVGQPIVPSVEADGAVPSSADVVMDAKIDRTLHIPKIPEAARPTGAPEPDWGADAKPLTPPVLTKGLDEEPIADLPINKADQPINKNVPSAGTRRRHFAFFRHRGAESKKTEQKKMQAPAEPNLDVNLIPAELVRPPDMEISRKLFVSGSIIFGTIVVIALAYLGITWYQVNVAREISDMELQIQDLNAKVAIYQQNQDAAMSLQERMKLIKTLLDNHVYWTNFFNLLEKYTISDVYYSNFSMAGTDRMVLAAVGKNYDSVAKQLVAFQNASDFVKSVRIDSATATLDVKKGVYNGVSFNVNLEFIPGVFLKSNK